MEDRDLERLIRKRVELQPSELPPATDEEFDAMLAPAGARGGILRWAVAAAAVALLAAAWAVYHGRQDADTGYGQMDTVDVAVAPAGLPPLRLIDIFMMQDANRAVVQDFVEIRLASVGQGEDVAGLSVTGISDGGLDLVDASGAPVRVTMGGHEKEWEAALQNVASQYQARLQSGSLTANDLDNLGKLAQLNERHVLAVLAPVAADPAARYYAEVGRILSGGHSLSHIQQLIRNAREGDLAHRVIAIQALCRIESPMARRFLRDCLAETDHPALPVIVDGLAAAGDVGDLPTLNRLAGDDRYSEAVRVKARAAVARIAGESK